MARARAGDPGGLWVVAGRQTAGRGRRGRAWQTPTGNLAASLLTVLSVPPARAATLGFVAGLALAEALAKGAGPGHEDRFALKWPNDVVADGGKLAGILLEAERLDGDRLAVVAGIGVNVAFAPDVQGVNTVSLAGMGLPLAAEALFAALSDAWVGLAALWDAGAGLETIRQRWLGRAVGIGGLVVVTRDGQPMWGVFDTIDAEGRLVLRRGDDEFELITAGDVHFGGAASAAAGA